MAITTLAAAVIPTQRVLLFKNGSWSNVFNTPVIADLFGAGSSAGGIPPNAATPATGTGEIPTNSTVGAFPITNPASGNGLYLCKITGISVGSIAVLGTLIFYDRLWQVSGLSFNLSTVQTISGLTVNRPDGIGADAEIWLAVLTNGGNASVTATVLYTNQAGTSGRSAVSGAFNPSAFGAPAPASIIPVPLQAGDTGVQSIQSVQLSAATGTVGNMGLFIARRVAEVPLLAQPDAMTEAFDVLDLGKAKIDSSACLTTMVVGAPASQPTLMMTVHIVEG